MKIRPLQDRILVKRLDEEEKTKGGIIIPDTAKEKPQEGKVIAVGGGKVNEDVKLKVAGVDVAFFCGGCRSKVAEAKADQQVQLVFDNEAFKKSYKIKKQPPKTEQAKTQQPEQQANNEQPEKNEKKS